MIVFNKINQINSKNNKNKLKNGFIIQFKNKINKKLIKLKKILNKDFYLIWNFQKIIKINFKKINK